MARSRKNLDDGRLLNFWSPLENAGAPIGCVATTFTMDAGHFEEQCLARFISMETDPAESARAYLLEREEKMSQVFACVLVDQRHAKDLRSLRWHMLPVRLPGSAIQHAKISILMWERQLRILIGSANLTPAGYRSNREVVAVLDFGPEDGQPLKLARDCIAYISKLTEFAPGTETIPGPRLALRVFLDDVRHRISGWVEFSPPQGATRCELIGVLPNQSTPTASIPAQLGTLWRGPMPDNLLVVSPFFDQSESTVDRTYTALSKLITNRGERKIDFYTSGRRLGDTRVEADIPSRLFKSPLRHPSTEHGISIVEDASKGDGDAQRPLHAKTLFLYKDSFSLFMIGSSNCTTAGLGLSTTPNAEANLVYVMPAKEGKFDTRCWDAIPKAEDVTDENDLLFTATIEASDDASAAIALLPAGFVEALFLPDGAGGEMQLSLAPDGVPALFEIYLPDGRSILSPDRWAKEFARSARLTLNIDRPISGLTVKWKDAEDVWQSALWVVNVTDTGLLAPPDELRNLNLEDLLAVLTGSGPLYRLIDARLEAKDARQGLAGSLVDPLKKVDSSQFLMRRMRRLARALEGLRARLEQPVASIEGLRWRLQGPLGPVALAHALRDESGTGAPFFISEVVISLQEVRWRCGSAIRAADREAALAETQAILKSLALENAQDSPENLRNYVVDQLQGIAS